MPYPRTPPTPERYEEDERDDPWNYETENDYIHRYDDLATILPPMEEGIAYHVHNVFDHVKENMEEIMTAVGGRINVYLLQVNTLDIMAGVDNFFYILLLKFYGLNGTELNDEGKSKFDQIRRIEYKLELAANEFLTVETTNNIFTWIQFVMRQPDIFQQHYLECFIIDTYNAHDGFDDGTNISCPKGIYERFLLAIGDACVLYCTQFKKKGRHTRRKKQQKGGNNNKSLFHKCDNPTYRTLIRLLKKEVPDINEFIKEWSAIFECARAQAMSPLQLKQDYVDFLDRKFQRYGLKNQLNAILKSANDLEAADIFKNKTFA